MKVSLEIERLRVCWIDLNGVSESVPNQGLLAFQLIGKGNQIQLRVQMEDWIRIKDDYWELVWILRGISAWQSLGSNLLIGKGIRNDWVLWLAAELIVPLFGNKCFATEGMLCCYGLQSALDGPPNRSWKVHQKLCQEEFQQPGEVVGSWKFRSFQVLVSCWNPVVLLHVACFVLDEELVLLLVDALADGLTDLKMASSLNCCWIEGKGYQASVDSPIFGTVNGATMSVYGVVCCHAKRCCCLSDGPYCPNPPCELERCFWRN